MTEKTGREKFDRRNDRGAKESTRKAMQSGALQTIGERGTQGDGKWKIKKKGRGEGWKQNEGISATQRKGEGHG